ncbi:ParB/RepB/Spo0J family partition protein [Candidatus Liberibacter sp.]|uniref:ParB/RepB/Spo0J family partition protein n=1 Tax=Candidatus Liberibacter sp. TaxID=34022 RepID=UPI0015F687DF|nr:ParB/RepB/Spo0J family partition protein [Candidatus Liberibacter sp.]MBA5723963.1 ParB/RepB/Spo0J family partition protein [Candidatus Liberibacter sp.]
MVSSNNAKRRLGRGLADLIGEVDQSSDFDKSLSESPSISEHYVSIQSISPSPYNPRDSFDSEELQELADSIRCHGIVQPVLVREIDKNSYEIIAGERRWRAAQLAKLSEIPVIIRNMDEKSSLEIAIIENVQRKDLNPLEEAFGYEKLISEYEYTQNDLGKIIGKSRSHISNILRLLKLPDPVKEMLSKGDLSLGHARALILTANPLALAEIIVSKKMSVRDTEELVRKAENREKNIRNSLKADASKSSDLMILERSLSDRLGLKVSIECKDDKGQVRIKYKTIAQLDAICSLLEKN